MGVCASRADEMKNDGCYMCQQNAYPNNKEVLHVHVSLTRPCLSHSLADAPGTISHGSDV